MKVNFAHITITCTIVYFMNTHNMFSIFIFCTHVHARSQTLIQGEEHNILTVRLPVNLGSLKVMDN